MSAGHSEALAHLLYGLKNDGGFVLLTGEIGTGKTTICRRLIAQVPDDIDLAVILNPKVNVSELVARKTAAGHHDLKLGGTLANPVVQ